VAAAGVNPEGGSRNLQFSNRPTESDLHRHLELHWRTRPSWAFFLRAETLFDLATAYEEVEGEGSPGALGLHARSHGQQFLQVANEKLSPGGVHFLDEPEAALSVTGQLAMLRRIHDVQAAGGQFVIATHSPILLAFPDAVIYEFTDAGLERVEWADAQPVRLTTGFLADPGRYLHHLFLDED
jgi:predicted ATPase